MVVGSTLAKVRVEPKKKVVEETAVSEMKPEIKEEQPSTIEETAESDKALEQRKTEKRKKDRKKKEKKKTIIPREPEENMVEVEDHPALSFERVDGKNGSESGYYG